MEDVMSASRKTKKNRLGMPKRKSQNGKNARASQRRRVTTRSVPRSMRSLPGQRYELVTLPYVWQGSVTSGIDSPTNKQFRMNSIYDPQYAAGGSQPAGYTQYSGLYDKYCVFGFDYDICVQTTTSNPLPDRDWP